MRTRVQAVVLPSETGEFKDELNRIFQDLSRQTGRPPLAGECSPALDIFETDHTVELSMDLPGVDPAAVRVAIKDRAVLIAGEKAPRRARGESSFHLVERGYGRFARTVRLNTACDTANARATLDNGELRVSLPKISERRSRTIMIAVTSGAAPVA